MVLKHKNKHQKSHSSNVGVGEDKISNLPPDLLHHILSFLPIKCGMSTCILSKRWKNVSNSIPILDFRDCLASDITCAEKVVQTQQFMNFLDAVLYHHEKPNIQKFCLSWDEHFDQSRVLKFINIVIKRKVEEFFLSKRCNSPFSLPLALFTCDSFTVLDLKNLTLNVPDTVSFPRLKILRLRHMRLLKGILLNNLLSNCPILEELSLIRCWGSPPQVLCIANIALKNLIIRDIYCFRQSTLKICAPNLLTISYGLEAPKDFVIDSFPELVEADIDIVGDTETFALTTTKLFEKLSNVKLLKICALSFQVSSEAYLLTGSPAFNNLIHLQFTSWIDCVTPGSDSIVAVRNLFRFLQLSPKLESVVFQETFFLDEEDGGCWSLDPKYSLPHLKSVKFKCFGGEPMELNAIKLFLKYAGFLEIVTVVAGDKLSKDHDKLIDVMKLLLMLPRRGNCVVEFVTSSENA